MKRRKLGTPKVPCAIQRVWDYPLAPDEMKPGGPMHHWAWSCQCGKHGDSLPSEGAARVSAREHFDGPQPAAGAWPRS